MADPGKTFKFEHTRRLHGRRAFAAVYDARMKKSVGPLVLYSRPNELGHPRLGLSVSRRVGNAVRRNRIKRLLREAFRLSQHDWPGGYDVVVVVRPHEAPNMAEYQRMLLSAIGSTHLEWERRRRRDAAAGAGPGTGPGPANA